MINDDRQNFAMDRFEATPAAQLACYLSFIFEVLYLFAKPIKPHI